MTDTKLFLQHELMLLAIADREGTFSHGMFLYSIAGAMVSELLLRERIVAHDDKQETVAVIDESPTGDVILDKLLQQMLQQIVESKKHHGLRHWVTKAAALPNLKHRIAHQLCNIGALKHDEKKVLWVFTQNVYPEIDGSWEDAVRNRMAKTVFDDGVTPDSETAILIALAKHSNLLSANFSKDKLRQHKTRINDLANGDLLASGATKATIQAVQTAAMVAVMIPIITS